MREQYSISEICDALDVSRSGYHTARSRPLSARALENERICRQIETIHAHRHTHCYGSPRMTKALNKQDIQAGENRVARLMKERGIEAKARKPFHPKTTVPDHAACPSPNLLAQEPVPTAPGAQLVSDITYIPTEEGWLYLVIVLDLFSRAILGWKLADHMQSHLVTQAICKAHNSGLVRPQAIFHSDRGSQYSSGQTRALLAQLGLVQSMSASGYCYDNAYAESAFASIKSEILIDVAPFQTKHQAATAIFDYMETFYNRQRLHSALDYQSPQDFLNRYFQNQNPSVN